eukprot:4827745-Pyramimonas_sp.AAC.1
MHVDALSNSACRTAEHSTKLRAAARQPSTMMFLRFPGGRQGDRQIARRLREGRKARFQQLA